MAAMNKKSSFQSARSRQLVALVLFPAACLLASATLHGSASPEAAPKVSNRALSFAERVAYQYAIEEVYWRHRIWPKENPGPKPSLDEVMSGAQVEKKVEDYLRDSQLVVDQWQRPITRDQLQAELERMTSHTKQPDVLGELFAGLGNDPFIIAECLARPALTGRLVARLNDTASTSSRAKSRDPVQRPLSGSAGFLDFARNDILENAEYTLPEISVPFACTGDTWTATSLTNAPDGRARYTAVWTGSEMIVWGGTPDGSTFLSTGGRYDPSTDSWIATSIINAPAVREAHTAVWTGSEMIIWGGDFSDGNNNHYLSTGGRYDPGTDSWTTVSDTNAPTGRTGHTAIWTGNEMIVWGGSYFEGGNGYYLNTGARYGPNTDSWTATSTNNAPDGREIHTALWTGTEMIVWGGFGPGGYRNTGGRYNPGADVWTATSTSNAPAARGFHTAVWTGTEMIVWGGFGLNGELSSGGRYSPDTDSWTPTSSTTGARYLHTAVWTGAEMIVWGGASGNFATRSGRRYNPNMDSWIIMSGGAPPDPRYYHTAVWTGSEMIIWGGAGDGSPLNSGGRYCAQPSTPIVQRAVSRKTHGSVGSFDISLPLSGTPGVECRSGGATNDYTIVVTFLANVSVDGNPQAAVTSGTATVGSGGVSDGGMIAISGNTVTIPLTNVANAQTINVTLNNVNGSTNLIIPMSILIADVNGNDAVNASDVSLTKSRIGQSITQTNFRSDVNASGAINAGDVSAIKSRVGTGQP